MTTIKQIIKCVWYIALAFRHLFLIFVHLFKNKALKNKTILPFQWKYQNRITWECFVIEKHRKGK